MDSTGDSRPTDLETEAARTVDGLLDHCDVPPRVARRAERLCDEEDSLAALDVVLRET